MSFYQLCEDTEWLGYGTVRLKRTENKVVPTEGLVDVERDNEVLVAHLGGLESEGAHDAGDIELEEVGRPLDLNVAAHLNPLPT